MFPLTILLAFSLAACNNNDDNNAANDNNNGKNDVANDVTDNNNKDNDMNNNNDNNNNNNNDGTAVDNNNGNNNKIELAQDAADRVAKIDEVDSANVLVTDNNAYVGVVLDQGVNETNDLEKKVADEVRATNGNYDNVYVSFNPDFAKQMADYGNRINNNEPVEGFFNEFSDTVKRMFPNAG